MNKENVPASGIHYEEYLEKYGTMTYRNVGVSMMPLLREGKDLFTVRKKGPERCRPGDVALYRRPPDLFVLHRVIEVRPDDYVMLGDHNIRKEYGIRDEDIIGVMTGFSRGGKTHKLDEPGYRLYVFLMMRTIPVRIFLATGLRKAKSLLRRIIPAGRKKER